jgi:hypothetical protein
MNMATVEHDGTSGHYAQRDNRLAARLAAEIGESQTGPAGYGRLADVVE